MELMYDELVWLMILCLFMNVYVNLYCGSLWVSVVILIEVIGGDLNVFRLKEMLFIVLLV